MLVSVSSNIDDVIRRYRSIPAEVERALVDVAPRVLEVTSRASRSVLVRRIYSQPIPTSSTGRPLWQREGFEGDGLLAREGGHTEGTAAVLTNDSGHAAARYRLGTPEGRQIVSPGVESVPWHAEAVRNSRRVILRLRQEAVQAGLRTA